MKKMNNLIFVPVFFMFAVVLFSSCTQHGDLITGDSIYDEVLEQLVEDTEILLDENLPGKEGILFYTRGIAPPDVRARVNSDEVVMVFKVIDYESGNPYNYRFRNEMIVEDVTKTIVYNGRIEAVYNHDSRYDVWTVEFEKWIVESIMDIFGPMINKLLSEIEEHGTDDFSFTDIIAGEETTVKVFNINTEKHIPFREFLPE